MSEQAKQPLTPEELMARKGGSAPNDDGSPSGDPPTSQVTPETRFATLAKNGTRFHAERERTTPDNVPSA